MSVRFVTVGEVSGAMRAEWKRLEEEKREVEKTIGDKVAQIEKDVETLRRRGMNPP